MADRSTKSVGVGICLMTRTHVLLGWHLKRAWWEFPGGAQEGEETLETTAHRELKEEAGLFIRPLTFVGYVDNIQPEWVSMFFAARLPEQEPAHNCEPDICREWKWWPHEGLPSPLSPVAVRGFSLALNHFDRVDQERRHLMNG